MNLKFGIQNNVLIKILRNSKFVILNSIFFIALITSSCSVYYKNFNKTEYSKDQIKNIPYALPFSNKTFIYKTNIKFYKNEISGLLILKKTNKNIYRIALTTQFGLKIFDFELDHGILKTEYCVEYLNKKIIIQTFQKDFNLLLMQNPFEHLVEIEDSIRNQKIWQLKSSNLSYNYIQNNESGNIEFIKLLKRKSEKISVGLYHIKENIPRNISLEHQNIKLKMNLKLIQ